MILFLNEDVEFLLLLTNHGPKCRQTVGRFEGHPVSESFPTQKKGLLGNV